MFFVFYYIPDWYKTQEMCDRGVSEDPLQYIAPINIKLKECVIKLLMIV